MTDACSHLDEVSDVQSYEPGENWWFCHLDDIAFLVDDATSFEHR